MNITDLQIKHHKNVKEIKKIKKININILGEVDDRIETYVTVV